MLMEEGELLGLEKGNYKTRRDFRTDGRSNEREKLK